VVGVGLHTLHHLVAVAAVPVGLLSAIVAGMGTRRVAKRAGEVALEARAE
jgi:hypothetical protein